jgi:hypothetical protein
MTEVKRYDPNIDKAGYAEVYIGNVEQHSQKLEKITNPPYKTPQLGDAPEEMQKEADRIYKDLRKNQYSEETSKDRAAAAGTMWKILKSTWEQDKGGKWVKKKKPE